MATLYSPKVVTDGLVLYLDAGNTKSYPGTGTNWTNLSNNSYTGTLTNGPTFNSANGGSIVFDGTDDVVQVPYYFPTDSSFTVSLWMQNSSNNNGHYLSQLNDSVTWDGVCIINGGSGGNKIRFILLKEYYAGISLFMDSSSSISLNTWYHITCLYNQTQAQIYINGKLDATNSYTGGYDATSYWNLGIGNRTTLGAPMNGKIATVTIYNRVLTASEILQNYNAQKGRFGL